MMAHKMGTEKEVKLARMKRKEMTKMKMETEMTTVITVRAVMELKSLKS